METDVRHCLALLTLSVVFALAMFAAATPQPASAHRAGCHTKHSCPSDHATYRWGPKRLLCVKPTSDERTARFKIKVRYGGLVYWCRR